MIIAQQQRCRNCGTPTDATFCAPCDQDRLLEQAQISAESRGGLRCYE